MNFVCTEPNEIQNYNDEWTKVVVFGKAEQPEHGYIGSTLARQVQAQGFEPSQEGWDLVSTALSVVAADESCLRKWSPDGWTREIELAVGVSDPDRWKECRGTLEDLLAWLTTDIWKINFIKRSQIENLKPTKPLVLTTRTVSLLSGGLDSLIGCIDLSQGGKAPLLVSQVAKGDKLKQQEFAKGIVGAQAHLQISHAIKLKWESERSQRARSLSFLAFGILAASSLQNYKEGNRIELNIPENGFISINVPLTKLRVGSLSTRTTHPKTLAFFQKLLDLLEIPVDLENPYKFKTKGEMLKECLDQALLKNWASKTTSCGRFARSTFKHCGRCVPCIVRRAAFQAWMNEDNTEYRYTDLSLQDSKHKNFDDVKSAALAVAASEENLWRWAGSALSTCGLEPLEPYKEVVGRGLNELAVFLKKIGAT